MPVPSYFDFHFHPVYKQFISRFEDGEESVRVPEEIRKAIDLKNDVFGFMDGNVLNILESQCCYDQIEKGSIRLGIANIVAIEHGIADSESFVSDILRSGASKLMDQQLLVQVRNGELSYNTLFRKELNLYRKISNGDNPLVKFLSRRDKCQIDENAFYMALGMEGGHNISTYKISKPDTPENGNPMNGKPGENLKMLQQQLWDEGMDLLYITLTHLSHIPEQTLATHAFGMKLLQHGTFYPVGNGLTELGREVIDAAYDMKLKQVADRTPIFIDIKHMSLKSRLDFYDHRNKRRENHELENIPIIASHMGVTGYSIQEWKELLKEYAIFSKGPVRAVEIITSMKKAGEGGSTLNSEFSFNPCSINMMDEDIIEVLKSGGLIGISLDVRILGFQSKIGLKSKDQSEYLSIPEFGFHFPDYKLNGDSSRRNEETESLEFWIAPADEERHPLSLCFNFIHIVSVGKKYNVVDDPWKHLCIGSDFDGWIEPLKICQDATGMENIESVLLKWLPVAEEAYIKENGGPTLLPHSDEGVDNEALEKLVRGIMFDNGKRFMESWLENRF